MLLLGLATSFVLQRIEVATLVGLKLIDAEATTLTEHIRQTGNKLTPLP